RTRGDGRQREEEEGPFGRGEAGSAREGRVRGEAAAPQAGPAGRRGGRQDVARQLDEARVVDDIQRADEPLPEGRRRGDHLEGPAAQVSAGEDGQGPRSEEHTSEL